ncbi:chemotaxis response regulator protein-glutamate methylesterase [Thauera sp. CAU 1555]|uniref:Protein-glutamate methylesterase/protein-glutamine glutaminase n=1 Tax=Thauera sedimentorum TaxID=2767595 RepID=A0ABR9B7A3_9RHOO|nr:chemotaxis response regulator protein-glutamate methylesterase [Thauera sedimentorum]MBC9071327.1 chemotaxis response regulator protein-glutamate methylesterase [Thauera sedimentorum]MBD8502246.1 chemotaxis response regulator protein-glutamate methylesterase [Thauera sedimentorum]
MTIRVLICDDSALMRALLSELIGRQPGIEVVGTAADPLVARELIRTLAPDVLTLDVEMPRMSGLEFLAQLMRLRPMPVVMVSNLTESGSEASLRALELGAVDVLAKPQNRSPQAMEEYAQRLGESLRAASQARVGRAPLPRAATPASAPPTATRSAPAALPRTGNGRLVFIGASTGGTEAIKTVLLGLPASMPPIFIVQHMPEMFTASFARRLDGICALHVKEAEDGEKAQPGMVYLAPGHSHLSVQRMAGGGWQCRLARSEPVNRHRPSVDVLFDSAAQVGAAAVGVLLTGMGKDGARGLLSMRSAGAWTMAQDQSSCVVYGMPREAVSIGAACEVVPLGEIAARLQQRLSGVRGTMTA